MRKRNKTGWAATLLRKAAQPVPPLGRLASSAGLEVDDLAPQLFSRPPRLRRLEVCRNVEFNQFRHHILLAGNLISLSGILQEPTQESKFVQAHVSLFPHSASCFCELSVISKNTQTKEEFFAAMRKITQIADSRVLSRK
jgi:hypothetical protein